MDAYVMYVDTRETVLTLKKILNDDEIKQFTDWAATLPYLPVLPNRAFQFKIEIIPTGIGEMVTIIEMMTGQSLQIDGNW